MHDQAEQVAQRRALILAIKVEAWHARAVDKDGVELGVRGHPGQPRTLDQERLPRFGQLIPGQLIAAKHGHWRAPFDSASRPRIALAILVASDH